MYKSMLKQGALVELRNGYRLTRIDKLLINEIVIDMDEYDEDLLHGNDDYDIVKVNNRQFEGLKNMVQNLPIIWTWERE